MDDRQADALKRVTVGEITRVTMNGETRYEVGSRRARGVIVHVVFDWTMFVVSLGMGYVVLVKTAGPLRDRALGACLFALLGCAMLGIAINETWWRRVGLDGTEVIVVRGNILVHRGRAFGRTREWERRLERVRRVSWLPRHNPANRYFSAVVLWSRFPQMYLVGWVYRQNRASGLLRNSPPPLRGLGAGASFKVR